MLSAAQMPEPLNSLPDEVRMTGNNKQEPADESQKLAFLNSL